MLTVFQRRVLGGLGRGPGEVGFASHWTGLSPGSAASLIDQMVKNLPTKQETWIRFLGREDPLEKGMATHSSILAW